MTAFIYDEMVAEYSDPMRERVPEAKTAAQARREIKRIRRRQNKIKA